ncbi:MAG TPA: cytochrome c biogenesis protein CcsA [Candidatus Binatia bacterium]|nr:cytochrome c biogenesis protein CcsA [Candidatus Binatia bacterium]
MTLALAALAALLYGVAAGVSLAGSRRPMLGAAALALVAHLALLGHQAFHAGAITLGVSEALSLFTWQAAFLLWAFCLAQPLQVLGVALFPLAAAGTWIPFLWPTAGTAIPLLEWKLQLHVVLSLLAAGLLTLAAVQALTLAVQDGLLHRHSTRPWMQAMPPLQTMEGTLFQLISTGFFLLSLSLVTGLLFVDDLLAQHLAHKTVLSVVAWMLFAVLLWGRRQRGWRGRIAVRWTLSAYGLLVLAYFGSKFVLEQMLGRHWT